MQTISYLFFNGDCEKALAFYERVLGGTLESMVRTSQTPMADKIAEDQQNNVANARLRLGENVLMASDCPPEYYARPQGFCVWLGVDSAAEAERIFQALQENGSVEMPMEKTFWAERFGSLTDQFGTPWMVSCDSV